MNNSNSDKPKLQHQSDIQTLKRIHGRLQTGQPQQIQRGAGELRKYIAEREKK